MRRIDVSWDTDVKTPRSVRITVHSQDQIGVLANLTSAITSNGANIANAHVRTTPDSKAVNSFEIQVEDARQLQSIIRALEMVPGVIRVERVRHISTSIDLERGNLSEEEE